MSVASTRRARILHLGAVADAWEERATKREGNVCTWIRSRKQVLSSKVSMICCLWLVLILADQGSAESLVLMAGLNVVQVLEYYCCTYLLILTCRATYIRPYKPHLDGRSLSGLKQTTLLKLNIHHLTLTQIKEIQRYKEHHSSLVWCTFIRYLSRKLQAFAHSVNGGVSSYLKLGWPLPGGAFYSANTCVGNCPPWPPASYAPGKWCENFLAVLSEAKNQYPLLFNFDDQKKAKDFQECEQNCGRKTDDFSQGQLSLL